MLHSDCDVGQAWRMNNQAETRRYLTKLSNIEDLNTFPENGTGNEEWLQWFREKQLQEEKRLQKIREEEQRKRHEREEKISKGAKAYELWLQKVAEKEQQKKKLLEKEEIVTEIAQSFTQQTREENERAFKSWLKKKAEIDKKNKAVEEEQKRKEEEEKNIRTVLSRETFMDWSEKAKSRPKPLPVALSYYAGKRNPYLGRIQCNPIEWKN